MDGAHLHDAYELASPVARRPRAALHVQAAAHERYTLQSPRSVHANGLFITEGRGSADVLQLQEAGGSARERALAQMRAIATDDGMAGERRAARRATLIAHQGSGAAQECEHESILSTLLRRRAQLTTLPVATADGSYVALAANSRRAPAAVMVTAAQEDLHARLAAATRADAQAYLEMLHEQGLPDAAGAKALAASSDAASAEAKATLKRDMADGAPAFCTAGRCSGRHARARSECWAPQALPHEVCVHHLLCLGAFEATKQPLRCPAPGMSARQRVQKNYCRAGTVPGLAFSGPEPWLSAEPPASSSSLIGSLALAVNAAANGLEQADTALVHERCEPWLALVQHTCAV